MSPNLKLIFLSIIYEKAKQNVEKRVGWQIDAYKKDDLIDAEMRRLKTDYVRTSKKKSIRTYTHKLLNKAKANIEAVGKGTFGKGISTCKVYKSKNAKLLFTQGFLGEHKRSYE